MVGFTARFGFCNLFAPFLSEWCVVHNPILENEVG